VVTEEVVIGFAVLHTKFVLQALPLIAMVQLVAVIVPEEPTLTVTEALSLTPPLIQERVKVVAVVKFPVETLPEVVLVPDQPPLAVQEVAFVEDQVKVVAVLYEILVAAAERLTATAAHFPPSQVVPETQLAVTDLLASSIALL
jgi:hypothetical protein